MRHHPGLEAAVDDGITEPGWAVFRRVVERAVNRGDVAGGRNVELIGMTLPAIVFHHITVVNAPIDRNLLASIIDDVVLPALRG